MAAIAKLVTYDGGIAFSDSVIKIQKRDGQPRIIPLEEIVSLGVRRPQEDTDGFIGFQTAGGQRLRLFFEDDQLQDAVRFKRQFDAVLADRDAPAPRGGDRPRPPAPKKQSGGRQPARSPRGRDAYPPPEPAEPQEKKSIFRRWWFWVILAVLVIALAAAAVFALLGGGGTSSPADAGDAPPAAQTAAGDEQPADLTASGDEQPAEAAAVADNAAAPAEGGGTAGNYVIEIKNAFTASDYEGKPAIIITYSWTNNSDQTTSAMAALYAKAFQDGVQMENAIMMDVEGYDPEAYMSEIRPGTTLDVQMAYVMTSTSPVEFEVEEFLGSSAPVTKTFDPNAL